MTNRSSYLLSQLVFVAILACGLFSTAFSDTTDNYQDSPSGVDPDSAGSEPQTILDAVIKQLEEREDNSALNSQDKEEAAAVKDAKSSEQPDQVQNKDQSSKSDTEAVKDAKGVNTSPAYTIDKDSQRNAAQSYSINLIKENVKEVASMSNTAEKYSTDVSSDGFSSELAKTVGNAVAENDPEQMPREKLTSIKTQKDAQVDNKEQQSSQKSVKAVRVSNTRNLKLSPVEARTAEYILKTRPVIIKKKQGKQRSGWIYLGHFARNGWIKKTLDIEKSLPKIGRNYNVMQSLNMRVDPPGKRGSGQLIKNLRRGDSVKILKVRQSGRNGHYWAMVEYQ